MNISAYHGTDYDIANTILSEGFIFKPNEKHWLGNGIYLFQDYSLARWWTTNPTKKFGSNIIKPAIIKCNIDLKEDRVLNLLNLEDYLTFSEIFENEFMPNYEIQHPHKAPSWEKLRCTYCDYLHMTLELDAIIGNFYKPDQPYLPPEHNNEFDNFLLKYTEVQICVFNKDIFSDINIEKV